MSTITAEANSAFITYTGNWDIEGADGSDRGTSAQDASASLKFSGTAFYLYGQLSSSNQQDNYGLSVDIDGTKFQVDKSLQGGAGDPLYSNTSLDPGKEVHTVTITLTGTGGVFNFDRILWTSSGDYLESEILINSTALPSNVSMVPEPENGWDLWESAMCRQEPNANITFNIWGNGIAVEGRGDNGGTKFRVWVDNMITDDVLTARRDPHNDTGLIDLYRNDTLGLGNHTVTLETLRDEQRSWFCVSKAKILTRRLTTSGTPTQTSSNQAQTPTVTPTAFPSPSGSRSRALSSGQVARTVIFALLIPALIIIGGIILYRRRRQRNLYVAARTVKYEQLCSKCGKPITDDYRLECVDPDCPAEVDLHIGCADWNIPERHSHNVHQVPNK